MKDISAIKIYPKTRIKPYDGMSVSAAVWAESHEEHRLARNAHDLLFHGSGIITGLEVLANDPPNQMVFISPGAAVDPAGNVIVLSEPVAYDFGSTTEGTLYLLLVHGEREIGGVDQEIKYIQNEFVIAARASLPKRPVVELARITLSAPGKAIKNSANPAHPGSEELDLRYREMAGPQGKVRTTVALCKLGKDAPEVATGWDHLGRECERSMNIMPVVDPQVSLTGGLTAYDVIFLSAKGKFEAGANEVKALRAALDGGKTLLVEALDDPADKSCADLFEKLELKLSALEPGSGLLNEPYLFITPPEGALGHQVLAGRQVIYSTAGYSLAWGGSLPKEHASRADIRSAHEWGINMIQFAVQRPLG